MTDMHTPGPWHVGNGDVYADGGKADDYDDLVICAIGQSGGFRSHEYGVVKAHKSEGKANARLIAAAPELLESVRDLLEQHITQHNTMIHVAARAAIAKATGQ